MSFVYYVILTSHKNGGTAVDGYNPALFWVLGFFWCRVDVLQS